MMIAKQTGASTCLDDSHDHDETQAHDLAIVGGGDGLLAQGIDVPRVERAVREILLAIGEDPQRDGLLDTPRRVARAYREMFAGLAQDPGAHLVRVFQQQHN